MSWSAARRVLAVRLDSIGDVLMTTPALRALKETLGCSITLLTSPAGAAVAPLVPEVDGTVCYSAPWMKVAAPSEKPDLRGFDAAVIFTVYSQSALPAALMCLEAGIPLRLAHCRENPYHLLTDWVPDPEPGSTIRHEVRRQLDLVASVGATTGEVRLSFRVPAEAFSTIRTYLEKERLARPLVVVHPGASAASRRYPPEYFSRAIDLLVERSGCEAVFTGDAGEAALVGGIRGAMAQPSRTLVGRLGLGELGALIAQADLLVSNNTGPAHIAAAVGTPVVDLYALTNPQHTPWQVPSRVLYHDVPCRNCYRSTCPAGHHQCLRGVAPEAVADAARDLLEATA